MEACKACEAFYGAGMQMEAHGDLVSDLAIRRSDGTVYRYRCRRCGMLWERHTIPADAMPIGGKQRFWKRV